MKKYFLSFGNGGQLYGSRRRIASEARKLDAFDEVNICDENSLGSDFWSARGEMVRKYKRGFGLWAWKPYLILNQIKTMEEGDLLMYADAGCSLNSEGRPRLDEYLDRARHGSGWLGFSLQYEGYAHTVGNWTKRDMLKSYQMDVAAVRLKPQIAAGCHFIRACDESLRLACQWYYACGREEEMNDEVSNDEHPEFKAHRHDQSAFTLLALKGSVESIPDETWFDPEWGRRLHYPVHARRWKHRIPWPTSWLRNTALEKRLLSL
jgi:hypothetical protein